MCRQVGSRRCVHVGGSSCVGVKRQISAGKRAGLHLGGCKQADECKRADVWVQSGRLVQGGGVC